jgi:large subunit ribosomal protein L21
MSPSSKVKPEASLQSEPVVRMAIVDWKGKQYQVQEGRYIDIDTRAEAIDSTIVFDHVLLAQADGQTWVGTPSVSGASVEATILNHRRGPKILVYKMRCKKGYRRKNGHRQGFTRIQITQVKVPA